MFLASEIIKKKRDGNKLSFDEINWFIKEYTKNIIPDYQMSAFLMAIFLKGMTEQETLILTQAILNSGDKFNFNNSLNYYVDKHSSGGIGDKTSLILTPIVASLGIKVPMISGRGLGHTGGTLDKLESISGLSTNMDNDLFYKKIEEIGASIIGQSSSICPADKKMYALRDVTGTVESLPLIVSSIMSKKLAEGLQGLVLDIKCGDGAFMKNLRQAQSLAKKLVSVGSLAGKDMIAIISNMDQPLGRFAGNRLEVLEAIDILSNKSYLYKNKDLYEDSRKLSLILAGHMISLAKKISFSESYKLAEAQIINGQALRKFKEIIFNQGGDINALKFPKHSIEVLSKSRGYISKIKTEAIGLSNIKIKAGRLKTQDDLDYSSGFEFFNKIGDFVNKGDLLLKIHGDDLKLIKTIENELESCFIISKNKVKEPKLIISEIKKKPKKA